MYGSKSSKSPGSRPRRGLDQPVRTSTWTSSDAPASAMSAGHCARSVWSGSGWVNVATQIPPSTWISNSVYSSALTPAPPCSTGQTSPESVGSDLAVVVGDDAVAGDGDAAADAGTRLRL